MILSLTTLAKGSPVVKSSLFVFGIRICYRFLSDLILVSDRILEYLGRKRSRRL